MECTEDLSKEDAAELQTLYITERVKHPCEHDNSSDGRTHPKKAQKQGKVNGEEQVSSVQTLLHPTYLSSLPV